MPIGTRAGPGGQTNFWKVYFRQLLFQAENECISAYLEIMAVSHSEWSSWREARPHSTVFDWG